MKPRRGWSENVKGANARESESEWECEWEWMLLKSKGDDGGRGATGQGRAPRGGTGRQAGRRGTRRRQTRAQTPTETNSGHRGASGQRSRGTTRRTGRVAAREQHCRAPEMQTSAARVARTQRGQGGAPRTTPTHAAHRTPHTAHSTPHTAQRFQAAQPRPESPSTQATATLRAEARSSSPHLVDLV